MIRLSPDQKLVAPFTEATARELIGYILGYYQSLFVGQSPIFPEGQAEFLFSVLRDGYDLREADGIQQGEVIDLRAEQFTPLAVGQLDHKTFSDPFASRLMIRRFTDLLQEEH